MIQEILFWMRVLYSFTLGRIAVKVPNVIYYLATFPEEPEDVHSKEALHFIRETLREYRQGFFGGILVDLPKNITIAKVQWAHDQLLQPGGFWRYEPNKYQIVSFVPSPSQARQLGTDEILQQLCVEACWKTNRCVILPRRFRQLRITAQRAYSAGVFPQPLFDKAYQTSIRPIFDEARLSR